MVVVVVRIYILSKYLEDCSLVLALGSVETREAAADTSAVVAEASAGAVAARLIAVAVQRVGAGGALLQVAGRATVARIAEAADMLHGIPRLSVSATGLGGEVLLRPAGAAVVAVVGAESTLASNSVVAGEAVAGTGGAIASALVGALHPRVKIVGVDYVSHPGEVLGAGALGAVGTSPLSLTIETSEALAVVVGLACAVIGAVVFTKTSLAVSSLVVGDLTPRLGLV